MEPEISAENKESLRNKAKALNNIFNTYLVCYFVLAIFYISNRFFHFNSDEYHYAKILIILWLIMKPIIVFFIIQIKSLLNQSWAVSILVALFIPFGELLTANIAIRTTVDFLSKEEDAKNVM